MSGTRSKALTARVNRGARLLDRFRPGWAEAIALDKLGMHTCDRCILGQLYGDFMEGCRTLAQPLPSTFLFSAAKHGFTLFNQEQDGSWEDIFSRFGDLADCWREAIRQRTGGSPP
jgi:hypothetical protein